MSQTELAEASETDQRTISRIEKGLFKRMPSPMPRIAEVLGLQLPDIDPSFTAPIKREQPRAGYTIDLGEDAAIGPRLNLDRLKVFATAEGGKGALIMSSDPVETIIRPDFLQNAQDAYAVIVSGESMVPAYRPGDLVLVNPHWPAKPDDDVVLQSGSDGTKHGIIKTLVGATDSEIKLRQWNPKLKDFSVLRKDWPECHRVVGKYSRR